MNVASLKRFKPSFVAALSIVCGLTSQSTLAEAEAPWNKSLAQASEETVIKRKKRSLLGNSTMLASGSYWALVPKGSVLFIPDQLAKKVVAKPTGKLIEWSTFLSKNGSWLHAVPIQMAQAQGKKVISQDQLKRLKMLNKVVVATCAGGPISVSPEALKDPAGDDSP